MGWGEEGRLEIPKCIFLESRRSSSGAPAQNLGYGFPRYAGNYPGFDASSGKPAAIFAPNAPELFENAPDLHHTPAPILDLFGFQDE